MGWLRLTFSKIIEQCTSWTKNTGTGVQTKVILKRPTVNTEMDRPNPVSDVHAESHPARQQDFIHLLHRHTQLQRWTRFPTIRGAILFKVINRLTKKFAPCWIWNSLEPLSPRDTYSSIQFWSKVLLCFVKYKIFWNQVRHNKHSEEKIRGK